MSRTLEIITTADGLRLHLHLHLQRWPAPGRARGTVPAGPGLLADLAAVMDAVRKAGRCFGPAQTAAWRCAGSVDFAVAGPAAVVSSQAYPDLFHEIFNQPERAQVLARLMQWLNLLSPTTSVRTVHERTHPQP